MLLAEAGRILLKRVGTALDDFPLLTKESPVSAQPVLVLRDPFGAEALVLLPVGSVPDHSRRLVEELLSLVLKPVELFFEPLFFGGSLPADFPRGFVEVMESVAGLRRGGPIGALLGGMRARPRERVRGMRLLPVGEACRRHRIFVPLLLRWGRGGFVVFFGFPLGVEGSGPRAAFPAQLVNLRPELGQIFPGLIEFLIDRDQITVVAEALAVPGGGGLRLAPGSDRGGEILEQLRCFFLGLRGFFGHGLLHGFRERGLLSFLVSRSDRPAHPVGKEF